MAAVLNCPTRLNRWRLAASLARPYTSTMTTNRDQARPRHTMRLADITIGARHRRDYGDLDALAGSIAEVGLLAPLAVTPGGRLIAGERRLRAVKLLAWKDVPVHVVRGRHDAVSLLTTERDENVCRPVPSFGGRRRRRAYLAATRGADGLAIRRVAHPRLCRPRNPQNALKDETRT